nr:general transcription factor 3C polypeptide 3-like isoform X1 [Ipomoea batatas]
MANFHIDENAMMELVCATHNPDGTNFNSNVVLSALETILNSEKVVDKVTTEDMLEEFDLKFRELSLKIQHLYFEDEKVALLLTSGLDISNERIQFLNAFYGNSKSTPNILWIPILDDHAAWSIEQYEMFRDKMWFQKMDDPHKRIARNFTRFVKENLLPHFQIGEEPILVSLDQHGRIVHTNMMHMIQTWSDDYIEGSKLRVEVRNNIIPFIEKEMKERSQGLDSLIFDIDRQISHLAREVDYKIDHWADQINDRLNKLIEKEKCIFLYGGNNIKWVREFTSKVHEVSFKTQSDIELIYVGKNEKVRASIDEEHLSYFLESPYPSWRFWTRLQSALLSRINYLNAANCHGDESDDEIAQGFKKLLGYECKGATMEGWALLSKGQKVVVCGKGAKMLRVINEYENWKENMALKSFEQAFEDYYNKTLHTSCSSNSHSCCAFEYPITLKEIPKKEKCPECFHDMQKRKASRAKRVLQRRSELKEEKKTKTLAAGLDWKSEDSDDEFRVSLHKRKPPTPKLLKNEENHQLFVDLTKALASLGRYEEAFDVCNLTLRFASDILSNERRDSITTLGAQLACKIQDAKGGCSFLRHFLHQHPSKMAAWSYYYKALSKLEISPSTNNRFLLHARNQHKDCIPPIIIAGHQFCEICQYQVAAKEYLEAHKLRPNCPLINLCIGTALINLAFDIRLKNKHQCVLQGLAFLYNNLQLCENSQEALYNIARAYQQVGLVSLAASYYEKVLTTTEKDCPIPSFPYENQCAQIRKPGHCDLRREAAYNLHLIYKASGAFDLARQVLQDHCTV